jgi:glycosyltransferase involved in cell wall biosynthesis
MSLPTVYRESKGLSVLEAMANAVPVVLPAHGTFPELIAATGAGLLHEPDSPPALAAELKRLLLSPHQARDFGQAGRQAIERDYSANLMAERTLKLYQGLKG